MSVTIMCPHTFGHIVTSDPHVVSVLASGRYLHTVGSIPFSSGSCTSSMGFSWDLNWDELCARFCLAFRTDFLEKPSTLSTEGGVVAAEDIALKHRRKEAVRIICSLLTRFFRSYQKWLLAKKSQQWLLAFLPQQRPLHNRDNSLQTFQVLREVYETKQAYFLPDCSLPSDWSIHITTATKAKTMNLKDYRQGFFLIATW